MTIRLNVLYQLSWKNNSSPEDQTSDLWITNLMLNLTELTVPTQLF